MANKPDLAKLAACAEKAARAAGALQKAKVGTGVTVEFKGEINLVTEVDRACEEIIINTIREEFADHDIMAEEGSGVRKDSKYKWIIDPLDGTTNFAHGYPLFCVSIGLEYKGELLLGAVYDAMRDEFFSATKGGGAFLNGKKIAVSETAELGKAMLATGFAYDVRKAKDNNLERFGRMIMNAQAIRRDGVAAIDLCYVACGRYDGFWELNLYPWDVAAGSLILTEAGGKVSRFDGSTYSIYDRDILATNGRIHQQASEVVA